MIVRWLAKITKPQCCLMLAQRCDLTASGYTSTAADIGHRGHTWYTGPPGVNHPFHSSRNHNYYLDKQSV